jgi:hypothetical protein
MTLTPHQKLNLLQSLEQAWEAANSLPMTTPCNLCLYWDAGFCKRWQDKIPEENKEAGCGEFMFNEDSPPF